MTRAERAAEALRLRGQGLIHREIAKRMGISRSYAAELCIDPAGHKIAARRESYRKPCVDCGKLTTGSNGHDGPERCLACLGVFNTVWTREVIIAAIQRFAGRYGRQPSATDFNPAHARHLGQEWRAERYYEDGDYPSLMMVQRVCGSWSAAIRAAGFTPGRPNRGAHLDAERSAA